MRRDSDIAAIKAALQDRIGEVCRKLLPRGRDEGGQWVSFNPLTGDEKKHRLPALKVRLRGGVSGAWKDWRSGDQGDVLNLIAYVERTDISGALTWARDFLGLKEMTREDREKMRRVARQRAQEREKEDERRRRQKLLDAENLFFGAPVRHIENPQGNFAFGDGSAAEKHALAYFSARGAALEDVPNLARYSFRFSGATEWWKGARWSRDAGDRRWKEEAGPLFPAVHSAMRNSLGIVTACHLTFLDPARAKKAPVEPAKLMYGEAKGAVIEIATGPGGLPFWWHLDRLEPAPLIVGEGIETVASFAAAAPEARAWAAGSLSGVKNAPVGLDCVSWILFARDRNEGNFQAQRQFGQALEALEASGKRVVVEASHVGDDFNDLAQGDG